MQTVFKMFWVRSYLLIAFYFWHHDSMFWCRWDFITGGVFLPRRRSSRVLYIITWPKEEEEECGPRVKGGWKTIPPHLRHLIHRHDPNWPLKQFSMKYRWTMAISWKIVKQTSEHKMAYVNCETVSMLSLIVGLLSTVSISGKKIKFWPIFLNYMVVENKISSPERNIIAKLQASPTIINDLWTKFI